MNSHRIRRQAASPPPAAASFVDAWLVPPDNLPQRVADKRRHRMRLSALFGEFSQYLRVERRRPREASKRTGGALEISSSLRETKSEARS